jgi:hypothetical protein
MGSCTILTVEPEGLRLRSPHAACFQSFTIFVASLARTPDFEAIIFDEGRADQGYASDNCLCADLRTEPLQARRDFCECWTSSGRFVEGIKRYDGIAKAIIGTYVERNR